MIMIITVIVCSLRLCKMKDIFEAHHCAKAAGILADGGECWSADGANISLDRSLRLETWSHDRFHRWNTVGFHNFNLRNFNLRVSNPNKVIVDVFLTRCRISMCQGLGPKKHYEISEIDRDRFHRWNRNPGPQPQTCCEFYTYTISYYTIRTPTPNMLRILHVYYTVPYYTDPNPKHVVNTILILYYIIVYYTLRF